MSGLARAFAITADLLIAVHAMAGAAQEDSERCQNEPMNS